MLLALLGDVMLGRGVGAEIGSRTPESFWGDVLPLLRSADLVTANLECAITTHPFCWTRTPKVFHFCAPPAAVELLRAAHVRLVSVANNHTLDFEEQGLLDTLRYLDAAGIAHAGAGPTLEDAIRPAIVHVGPMAIGMIAITDNEPDWAARPESPGVHFRAFRADAATLTAVEELAARARERGADFVILSLHWGPNMVQRPPRHFRNFAHAVLDRGVDLVHGHSAHVFQGVEVHRAHVILYDAGDFLDDYAVEPRLRNDQSLLFLLDLDDRGVRELRMMPVRLGYAVVNLATGNDFEEIRGRMQRLSAELGTRVERTGRGLRVIVREDAQHAPPPDA